MSTTVTKTLPIKQELKAILEAYVANAGLTGQDAIISFKDPNYSAEQGGFHPVEIYRQADGSIYYITDFSYQGWPPHAELVKELDFDFGLGLFQQGGRDFPIEKGRELFKIWQQNFLAYYEMSVYRVTAQAA